MTTFAHDFQRELDRSGMTVTDVARRSGINKGTLYHYLRGDYEPKQKRIALIAKALGVNPTALCGMGEELDETDALRESLIAKIRLMDDETVASLNQLADSILSRRR